MRWDLASLIEVQHMSRYLPSADAQSHMTPVAAARRTHMKVGHCIVELEAYSCGIADWEDVYMQL